MALPCVLMFPGCGIGYFADRATNPIVNAHLSDAYTTLSMNAGRRTILVQYRSLDNDGRPRICAEAPPDALEAYANAAAIAARGSAGASGGSLGAELGRNLGTSAAPLLYRTQGLQMLRDLQFTLCIIRLNGTITDQQYLSTIDKFIPQAIALVRAEIPAIVESAKRAPVTINAPPIAALAVGGSSPPAASPAAAK